MEIPGRRVLHQKFNDLTNPEPVPLATDYSVLITSSVPIVVQQHSARFAAGGERNHDHYRLSADDQLVPTSMRTKDEGTSSRKGQMRALVKTAKGPGHVSLEANWPIPTAKPGWVVVEVAGCGICGTDLHIVEETYRTWPPVVLGHEYSGRIVEVGAGVTKWQVGDRVVCEQHTGACLTCDACRRGAIHLCPAKRSPGWGIDGAFADFVTLPCDLLHRIPDGVSFLSATVTEPTAICITGLDRVGLRVGERILVIGPGSIGLISALLARAHGASEVLLVGRPSSRQRLELASSLDIKVAEIADPAASAADFAQSDFDIAIDTTGAGDALSFAVMATRRLGRVLELGLSTTQEVSFALNAAMTRSISIHMSMSSEYSSWDRALAIMASGAYDPAVLTALYSLENWESAFHDVASRKVIKAVISPKDFAVVRETS
jgi:L-iditol 2-dehydrogenase